MNRVFKLANFRVAVLILLSFTFSFILIDRESIWLDEAFSIAFASLQWPEYLSFISSTELNMSFYSILLKSWIDIFGNSETAVRSLSAFFAVPTVVFAYFIAKRIFDENTATIAAVLLSLNTFFVRYAQEARGYSLLLCLTTISMFLFFLALDKQKTRHYIALGLINALVIYTHFFGLFALLSQAIALIVAPKDSIKWKSVFLSTLISTVLLAPLAVGLLGLDFNHWNRLSEPTLKHLLKAVRALTGSGLLLSSVLYCICGLISFIVVVFRWKGLANVNYFRLQYVTLLLWAVLPIACLYVLSKFIPAFENRYTITALTPIVVLCARGIVEINRKPVQVIVLGLLVATSLYNLHEQYQSLSKRDWRTAVQMVLNRAQANDAILFYTWYTKFPFEYYYQKFKNGDDSENNLICVWPSPFSESGQLESYRTFKKLSTDYEDPSKELVTRISYHHDRLWVVFAIDNVEGTNWSSGATLDEIEHAYGEYQEYRLNRIRIRRYTKINE